MPKAQMKKFKGTYQLKKDSTYQIELKIEKNTLTAFYKWNMTKNALFPESENKFFIKNSNYYFDFNLNDNGEIESFYNPSRSEFWIKLKD